MAGGHGGGGSERWLLTYADLITLLLAYFIVMFAISQTDLAKFQKLAASVRRAFNTFVDPGVLQGTSEPGTGFFNELPARNREYVRISSALTQLAKERGLEGRLSVNTRREGVVISISTSILFDSGSARIRPESRPTLDAIADLLRDMPNEIRVAGHTDDIPPLPKWPSNWELSAARAIQVVKYLITEGKLDPRRLSAVAYAEYHPLVPNDTPAHRQKNRRVDILIVFETKEQAIAGPIDLGLPSEQHQSPKGTSETAHSTD